MLSRVPFVGLVLAFLTGIMLADRLFFCIPGFVLLSIQIQMAVIFTMTAIFFWFYTKSSFKACGICLFVFLFTAGALTLTIRHQSILEERSQLAVHPYEAYQASVESIPEKRARTIRVEVCIKQILIKEKWLPVHVRALLNIPQEASLIPAVGDDLIVNGNVEQPASPLNPYEFDYQRYLWNKGIVWIDYLPEGSYQMVKGSDLRSDFSAWSSTISQWSVTQFRENLKDDASYGLVKAMLLGRRDDLRTEQVDDYTTSGTVHILSVSGMHVAILFFVIRFLLGWVKRFKGGKYLYVVILSGLLGFYALVTGMSPSVQRATLMCMVLVIAEVYNRKYSSVNTLAFSALLILLVDPQALFDVGFQLSYLAMTGIFLFYKPLNLLWSPSGYLQKYLWQITVLSFAAQLATFPLCLYYFHQFPFYFWLVNPFVITFTNLLLPAALLLLLVCAAPFVWLKLIVGCAVHFFAWLTNIAVAIPKKLPGYLIENLYLSRSEIILLYCLMFVLWYAFESRAYVWLRYGAGLVVLFVLTATTLDFQTYITSKAMIHAVPRHLVLSFKEGDKLYIYSDKAFINDTPPYDFHLKNYAISEGVLETVFLNNAGNKVPEGFYLGNTGPGHLVAWHGKTVFIGPHVDACFVRYQVISEAGFPVPGRIVTNPSVVYLPGGEMSRFTQERWLTALKQSGNHIHDLRREGALLLP